MEAGVDFVHCMKNYVVDCRDGKDDLNYVINNDFETHNQILNVVRECFEYVEPRRQVTPKTITKGQGTLDDQASYDSGSN